MVKLLKLHYTKVLFGSLGKQKLVHVLSINNGPDLLFGWNSGILSQSKIATTATVIVRVVLGHLLSFADHTMLVCPWKRRKRRK